MKSNKSTKTFIELSAKKKAAEGRIDSLELLKFVIEFEHELIQMSWGGFLDKEGYRIQTLEIHKESLIYDKFEECYVEILDVQEGINIILINFINKVSKGFEILFIDNQMHIAWNEELRKQKMLSNIDYGIGGGSASSLFSYEGDKINIIDQKYTKKSNKTTEQMVIEAIGNEDEYIKNNKLFNKCVNVEDNDSVKKHIEKMFPESPIDFVKRHIKKISPIQPYQKEYIESFYKEPPAEFK